VLGAGEQAGAAGQGAMAFGATGLPFCARVWAKREACVCHMLRSGRGNVKEEEPDQKRGSFCLFLSQVSDSEGKPVGACVSDRERWGTAVLEVTQLQTKNQAQSSPAEKQKQEKKKTDA